MHRLLTYILSSNTSILAPQEEFDHDRELRLARDASMAKQLTDHEHTVWEQFEKQIVSALLYHVIVFVGWGYGRVSHVG